MALWPYGLMALWKCRVGWRFSRSPGSLVLESSMEMGSSESWLHVWVVFVDEGHEGRQSMSVQARAVFIQRTLWWLELDLWKLEWRWCLATLAVQVSLKLPLCIGRTKRCLRRGLTISSTRKTPHAQCTLQLPEVHVYRNCMVCTVHMGDNNMRKPRPRTKSMSTLILILQSFVFIPEGCSCAQNVAQW